MASVLKDGIMILRNGHAGKNETDEGGIWQYVYAARGRGSRPCSVGVGVGSNEPRKEPGWAELQFQSIREYSQNVEGSP